jgi:predicted TIM-barrel fold metal-dependent hydrolase
VHEYEPPPARPDDFAVPGGFRFVDPHIHLFDHAEPALSWGFHNPGWEHPRLKGSWRLDGDRWSVPQLRTLVSGLGVVKVVHVQAANAACGPVAETAWLQQLTDRYGWPNAIVGPCDLTATSAPDTLGRQAAYPAWRGVRDLADPSAIGSDEWLRGYGELLAQGGTCDLMVSHEYFDQVHRVAERFPDVPLVLEHAGLPVVSRLDSYFAQWRAALARLASAPNVVIKISALSSGAVPMFFTDSIRHWVRECIELFGPQRCMFASNWPIDNLFTTYPRLLATFRTIVEDLTDDQQDAVFAGTAERVYRI